jgi:hypothetical protein
MGFLGTEWHQLPDKSYVIERYCVDVCCVFGWRLSTVVNVLLPCACSSMYVCRLTTVIFNVIDPESTLILDEFHCQSDLNARHVDSEKH